MIRMLLNRACVKTDSAQSLPLAVLSSVFVCTASLLLLTVQASIVLAQSESTPPPFPPPGKLVDVGGWRLHLNCTGEARPSQPTVILESGLGDFSVEWSLVQPGVAAFARVCSYDRAGDGWSDLGPHPRTMRQIVYELHTLLDNAGVKRPLVLVGHSYGGWLVRLYASSYPAEVVGMVLVEAGAGNPWRKLPDGKLVRSSDLATGRPIPAVKLSGPLRVSDIPPDALSQMRAGIAQLVKRPNEPPRNKLPADAQRMRAWALAQESGEEGLAVDAAHMIAITHSGTPQALEWNEKGLALARQSKFAKAQALVPAMHNNMAWDLHDLKRYDEALVAFRSAQEEWTKRGKPRQIQVAKWSVAQCLRSLKRDEEAAVIERALEAEGFKP